MINENDNANAIVDRIARQTAEVPNAVAWNAIRQAVNSETALAGHRGIHQRIWHAPCTV